VKVWAAVELHARADASLVAAGEQNEHIASLTGHY
jgi:hypothetical protein